jgi:hypothetical protein
MKNPAPVHGKYFLRSLHQEIDLYDRKLAYLANYQVFASAEERAEAEKKLLTKRAALANVAKEMAAEGIEFNPSELPRSFRAEAEHA